MKQNKPSKLRPFLLCATAFAWLCYSHAYATQAEVAETRHQFQPLIISIVKGNRIIAYLNLDILLETKNKTPIELYKAWLPRLRDAYFTDLYGVLCDLWLPSREPNPVTVRQRLMQKTQELTQSDQLTPKITRFYFYTVPQ